MVEKLAAKENTPADRVLELRHGSCADGWNAHFASLGLAHIDKNFCGKRKQSTNHRRCVTLASMSITCELDDIAMQKGSTTPTSAQMIIHCAMGLVLGALMGLVLIVTNQHIFALIATSSAPSGSMALFIGFFSFVVGTGATISGFIFTAIELNALEAKQQTERINKRRGAGT